MTHPLPREHGAWGLLLLPFLAGAILARQWSWLLLPALGLVLFGFLLREPLTILARQRFVWRSPNPQSGPAARWLLAELLGAAVCLALLLPALPTLPLATLAAAALVLTATAVICTVLNKQRSVALQLMSAAGLGSTALLSLLAATGSIPSFAWPLWAVLTLHGAVSILTVHTRLACKRTATSPALARYLPPLLSLAAAPLLPAVAIPLLFSAAANLWELRRLHTPANLQEPLKHVGFRALAASILHASLTIAALWQIPS
jgi:hypothetical protein